MVLARSGVAHFEQGTSKERLELQLALWDTATYILGYTCHVRSSLLPWGASIILETLEARMGTITPAWEGSNNSWVRTVTERQSSWESFREILHLCQALVI